MSKKSKKKNQDQNGGLKIEVIDKTKPVNDENTENAAPQEENAVTAEIPAEVKDDAEDESAAADDGEGKNSKKLRDRLKFDWELEENILEALDEDALDLTEADESEAEPIEIKGKSAITPAQALETLFGLFLLIFAIIGIIATVIKSVDLVKAQKDNSAQLEIYENFILPLAACDTPTFEGASSLNEDVLLSAACWDIIFNPSAFYEFSGGTYKVSYLDVDRRIAKLFGPGLSYSHKSVGDTELMFEYDEESGMYTIPAFPRSQAYYPDVTDVKEVDGGFELTVCYHLPITNWIESVDNVEKIMIYTLVPDDTDYTVTALRLGELETSEAN